MGAKIQSTASKQAIAEIRIYPGKDSEFALYDDDGVSYDYEKGKGTLARLQWNDAAARLTVSGDSELSRKATGIIKVMGK